MCDNDACQVGRYGLTGNVWCDMGKQIDVNQSRTIAHVQERMITEPVLEAILLTLGDPIVSLAADVIVARKHKHLRHNILSRFHFK